MPTISSNHLAATANAEIQTKKTIDSKKSPDSDNHRSQFNKSTARMVEDEMQFNSSLKRKPQSFRPLSRCNNSFTNSIHI